VYIALTFAHFAFKAFVFAVAFRISYLSSLSIYFSFERTMPVKYDVVVEPVHAEVMAAVRVTALASDIARVWKPALDQVWVFMKTKSEFRSGKNLFLYHHPEHRNDPMNIDFGVQVAHRFEPQDNVQCIETPAGEVARTVHVGPYDRLGEAHNAIHEWCAAHNRKIAHASWEIYGHWNNDPALLETTIKYLLAD
jgi:effector-binding domain-containing protein